MLTRLNLLLLLAVIASAMLLVRTAYETRRLFADTYRAEAERDRLAGEHTRLEAERQLQATNLRVERSAREKLGMRTVTPAVTLFDDAATPAPMPASAPAGRAAAAKERSR